MKRTAPEKGKVSGRKNERLTEEPKIGKRGEMKGREQEGLKKRKKSVL